MQLDRTENQIDQVPSKGIWSIIAKVDSTSRSGKQVYQIILDIKQNGRSEQSVIPFEFFVVPGWRALPASLDLDGLIPGDHRSVDVEMVDAFPELGIVPDHLEWSGRGVRDATWHPIPPGHQTKSFTDSTGQIFHVRGFIRVEIDVSAQPDVSHCSIVMIPADSKRSRLELPVMLKLSPQSISSIPEVLVFGPRLENGVFTRRFYLKQSQQESIAGQILCPPGIKVRAMPSTDSNLKVFELIIDFDKIAVTSDLALRVMSADQERELLRIPVKILGEARKNESQQRPAG